ncbi:MAG TPA: permease prefix domain 2-containing transporter, partial [Gemmatimonadaceae bacterium]
MKARAEPPRLARRLLARALPDDVREPVDGDLLELFSRRSAQYGITRARLWYWMQVASFSTRFLLERLRDRARRRGGTSPQRRSQSLVVPSAVDVRLAVRMLAKYPVLSGVSMFGMAVAIAIGATVFGLVTAVLNPTMPIEDGDRIVAVQTNRADVPGDIDRQVLHDFVAWRTELTRVR